MGVHNPTSPHERNNARHAPKSISVANIPAPDTGSHVETVRAGQFQRSTRRESRKQRDEEGKPRSHHLRNTL